MNNMSSLEKIARMDFEKQWITEGSDGALKVTSKPNFLRRWYMRKFKGQKKLSEYATQIFNLLENENLKSQRTLLTNLRSKFSTFRQGHVGHKYFNVFQNAINRIDGILRPSSWDGLSGANTPVVRSIRRKRRAKVIPAAKEKLWNNQVKVVRNFLETEFKLNKQQVNEVIRRYQSHYGKRSDLQAHIEKFNKNPYPWLGRLNLPWLKINWHEKYDHRRVFEARQSENTHSAKIGGVCKTSAWKVHAFILKHPRASEAQLKSYLLRTGDQSQKRLGRYFSRKEAELHAVYKKNRQPFKLPKQAERHFGVVQTFGRVVAAGNEMDKFWQAIRSARKKGQQSFVLGLFSSHSNHAVEIDFRKSRYGFWDPSAGRFAFKSSRRLKEAITDYMKEYGGVDRLALMYAKVQGHGRRGTRGHTSKAV